MLKVKRDQITGLILCLIGIVVAIMVSRFSVPFKASYPGPKMMPSIAAFGFVVCGLGIFFQSTFSKKEEKVFLLPKGWAKMGICFLVLCAYVFLMKYFGYMIVTPVVTYCLCTLFARDYKTKWYIRLLFSLILTGMIYVVYVYAFGLSLPKATLF